MYSLEYCPILPFVYSYVVFNCIIKWIFQRRRCCAFFWLIRHKSPRYNRAFSKKTQHLWRWISLRMLTRGRLVPRQPRAIKRTTPTALHHESVYIAKFIHLNNGATPTALRDETIVWVIWLIRKREMICVISSRKIWQITRPFDANYHMKWRCL